MEYIRVKNVSESDFDSIVKNAGGSRIIADGSADYLLNEALIELKFIQEEGFEIPTRQAKIANLFRQQQPQVPVVVVNPETLDEVGLRTYYNIVAGPIKTHVKKADKQLNATAQRYDPRPIRVLVILNLGYTALLPDEFKAICVKCVLNDTTKIDWLICGGIYFHSDKFDNYLFARFEPVPVNVNCLFPSFDALAKSWGKFGDNLATSLIRDPFPADHGRLPVLDLSFEVDGIRYVKPAPRVPSNVWPPGCSPRENTTGIDKCPPVAVTYATFSEEEWKRFKKLFPYSPTVKSTYQKHLQFRLQREAEHKHKLKFFVPVYVRFEEFSKWISKPESEWKFTDVAKYANELFGSKIRSIRERANDETQIKVIPLEYIYLVVHEIGQDKINDYCSIYYISETPGFKRNETIVENEKVFFEYGLAIAAAYAAKRNVEFLIFNKKRALG